MKNLRNIPPKIYFNDILSEIEYHDYTTYLNLNDNDYINLTFSLADLENISGKSIVNRQVPLQDNNTYNAFYQYYNYSNNIIKAESSIKNNYVDISQYPEEHSDYIGSDGTIIINMKNYSIDNLELSLVQEYDTVPKEDQDDTPQYYISTLQNITDAESSDGYKIVNNKTFADHSILANQDYQKNKYSTTHYLTNLQNPATIYELSPGFYNLLVYSSTLKNHLEKQNDEGIYIYYKLIDSKNIVKNNDIFEQEIEYIFNDFHQINIIKGYLYNFKQSSFEGRIKTSDRKYYGTANYMNCDTSYFLNDYTEDDDHYDEVILTAYSYNNNLNEYEPIGSRNLLSPDVIDLEKLLPIKATYTNKIKLVISQKYTFDSYPESTNYYIDNIINKNSNAGEEAKKYESVLNTNTIQFKRCAACSKFLPGFDNSLMYNNKNSYHTSYDTKTFKRFKSYEINIPTNTFINERIYLEYLNYYPYLYNVNYSNKNLNFKVNLNSYKHNEILRNGYKDLTVSLVTYNYDDITNVDDATVLESYYFDNLNNIISTDFTSDVTNNSEYFINIKLNYNQSIDNIINFMTKLNYYNDIYNNYEYDFNIPQYNNIISIKKLITYEYDNDSTTINEIKKYNTNTIFIHKNINEIKLDNTADNSLISIQLIEIYNNEIVNEKQFDGTNYYDNYDSTISLPLNNGINIINFSDFTHSENVDYIVLFFTDNFNIQNNNFDYSNTAKFDISYDCPMKITLQTITSNNEAINIINNNNIFTYKIYYTKKV